MNTLTAIPGSRGTKVDHYRFLVPLLVGNASSPADAQRLRKAEQLYHAIRQLEGSRKVKWKNLAVVYERLTAKSYGHSGYSPARKIAMLARTPAAVGEELKIDLYRSRQQGDVYFDIRSGEAGGILDQGIQAVKVIAAHVGLDGVYTSHFVTVPYRAPTDRRALLVGHFGGAVLVTKLRHEFLTTHELIKKLEEDEKFRTAALERQIDGLQGKLT